MQTQETIKDWRGKIIGYIITYDNGNQIIQDFYHKILGTYDKRMNVTRDFYNRIIARGNQLPMLLNK